MRPSLTCWWKYPDTWKAQGTAGRIGERWEGWLGRTSAWNTETSTLSQTGSLLRDREAGGQGGLTVS